MKAVRIAIVLAIVLGAAAAGEYAAVRNGLAAQREAVAAQWAGVETVLQRRADLIPSLVAAAARPAARETEVFRNIAEARAAFGGARAPQEKIQAYDRLAAALSRLLLVAENYPQLRADPAFLRLQGELSGSEYHIAVERRKYNEALQRYNASIEVFPNNWVAALAGFSRNDAYFKTEAGAAANPGSQDYVR